VRGVLIELGRYVEFALRVLAALPGSLVRRGGPLLAQFERVAWGSLPVVAAAGFSVGVVTWFQTRRQLAANGMQDAMPGMLAFAVIVETGPLLASVLVASRMGAGLAAEIGSMNLTEQLEAQVVLGSPPISALFAPRVLACVLALPLLTILIDATALLGGMLAESLGGSLTPRAYALKSLDFLWLRDVVPATLKPAVFGFLIGTIGCWTGLRAPRSTEGVGQAATRGVVLATLAVFFANVLIVPWIQGIVDALGLTI
jgi:phospholipid/cholesterol/gamma-HCH transport system permease protein